MLIFWGLWSLLLLLVALIWASRHLEISRAKREHIPLSSRSYPGPPVDAPFVSVLIAAKDEQANIGGAVRTMLEQDYPNFELIVVDDRSTDRTAEILDTIQAECQARGDNRLKVIHVKELQPGWFGKNNAMREGLLQARADWFCFGDADCKQTSSRSLSMAVHHALDWNIDFLSVLPGLETQSVWERIIQPVCGAVMVFWFHPKKVNNPQDPAAYANGAFMLMKRSCYDAIGGHDAVRTEVNEDMHMARLAKEHAQRLVVVQSDDLYTVRMYAGLGEIWRGWSRIFYGCFGTFRRLRITMLMLLFTSILPYGTLLLSALVVAASGWSNASPGWHWVLALSALGVVMQQSVIYRFYGLSHAEPRMAPTWIVGVVICIGMLGNAMLKLRGRRAITWRGTTYRGQQVTPPAA
jgi:glycosyltransferase involved in cell wall biosynthesis